LLLGSLTGAMAMTPSVGDILMLSQTAWRIGRAFTQGKKSAPAEFAEVEREAEGLSEALQLVAETLNSNGSILDKAEDTTKSAVSTILDSAQRTLSDLESFVARYRIIKPQTGERSWSDLVLTNYKTIKWTTEGGDISALRDMLHIHTSTINLTMQALQSQSLARLEKVVRPMAENVASIHDRAYKIDDLHRVIMAIVNGTPALTGQIMHERLNSTASNGTVSALESTSNGVRLIEATTSRTSPYYLDRQISRQVSRDSGISESAQEWTENSTYYGDGAWQSEKGYAKNIIDWDFESGAPPISEVSIGDRYTGKPIAASCTPSPSSFSSPPSRSPRDRISSIPRRESSTLPGLLARHTEEDTEEGSSREANPTGMSPMSPGWKRRVDSKGLDQQLPPPALSPKARSLSHQPATPTSVFSEVTQDPNRHLSYRSNNRRTTQTNVSAYASKHSSLASSPTSPSDPSAFEKALFRNSAIICDVRSTLVEFAEHNPDEQDPRFEISMETLGKEARVCVIRKREHRENGGTRIVASIWTLSDDGEVRCQQKLPEFTETVPYCSFFESEKVGIMPPMNGEITLRLHAHQWGDREQKDIKTKWVNYVFESEAHANDFQSAIFGRKLLGSFRTNKTAVLHEGFKGAFAFEEQFANIEVLRLWEDDGVNTAGGSGGVMALLHMSSNFGQGYAKWWMNSSRQQVRVKDEHNKFAKLKGIDIRVLRIVEKKSTAKGVRSPTTASDTASLQSWEGKGKKGPERSVTGVRIEFKTEEERAKFVDTVKRVQERMLPLPDI
jgi:hypothetical protein